MAETVFGPNEIIVLLGAGASVDADLPDSKKMIDRIERLVLESPDWKPYKDLYYYIKSSIFFADGLRGDFGDDVSLNIERLANVLDELPQQERHSLYPFVGAWHPRLREVVGKDFESVHGFQRSIVEILRNDWVALRETEKADYYKGLLHFQREYEYPLRVFSLNYDLCVEKTCGAENVQRGFFRRTWDWRMFGDSSEDTPPLLLYKLHGSTDWKRFSDGRVKYRDTPSTIGHDEVALIFGTSYKLQYTDPFLFLVYELRRWTLDSARIIVCIGYGFSDEHINGILTQSLLQNRKRKLLVVTAPGDRDSAKERVAGQLRVDLAQFDVLDYGAKTFLEKHFTMELLSRLVPVEEDPFPESN